MRIFWMLGTILFVGCETDKSITVQNPTPKADVVSHSNGDTVLEGFTTRIVGSVTDSNHTADQLMTKWYLNGDIYCDDVIPNEYGETECEFTFDAGEQEITLAVLDLENARGEDSILISVTPTNAPVADILTPIEDGLYYADQLLTFEGVVSDAEDSAEVLTAYWESNVDGLLENVDATPSSSGQVLGYGTLSEGTHAIELHVEDSTGKVHTDAVILEIGAPNSAPTCGINSPASGMAGPSNDLIVFEAFADDVDIAEDQLLATWSSDKDGSLGTSPVNSDGTIIFPFSDLSVNTHLIALTVQDEMGESCTSSIVYTIGTPPSVVIDEPLDGSIVDEGTQLTFAVTVSDAQEQPNDIALNWELNGGVFSTASATSSGLATFVDSSLTNGTYNLVVTATDGDGLTDSDQITFTVNGVPSSPIVSISPSSPVTGDQLAVSIDTPSLDPDGDPISYTYEWQLGGVTQPAHTTSSLPSTTTNKGEQWIVLVTPSDGNTVGNPGMDTVTIQNTPPSISPVTITGNLFNDSQLTCFASGTDPDGTVSISYEWMWGGSVVGTNALLDVSTLGAWPQDSIGCTATATDGDGANDISSASVVLQNRPPMVTASISANGSNNTGVLTCVENVSDPDGEIPSVNYEWFNTNGSLGSLNPLQLDPSMGGNGDTIQCVITVQDAYGTSATDTASHVIQNSLPVVDSVSLSPNSIDVSTGIVLCNETTSDADGDAVSVTYEWLINGALQSGSSNSLMVSWEVNTQVVCRVTPHDGSEFGVPVEASTVVQNTPPVVSNVSISPNTIYTNDVLTVSALITDADSVQAGNLSMIYNWYVDNSLVQSGGVTLDGSVHFDRGQAVFVEVTPNDGMTNGTPLSSPLIIVSNTPPVLSSVLVTPNTAVIGTDDLYCDVVATDLDGDAILYTYEWSDSTGVQQTTADVPDVSDTFLTGGLTEDTWNCEVTPFDGTDYGTSMTSSAVVESGCSSAEFDGDQDGILLGDSENLLGVSNDFSVSAWVWVNSPLTSPSLPIFSAESTNSSGVNNNTGYSLRIINGSLALFVGTGTTGTNSYPNPNWYATDTVSTDRWVHIAGTRQGTTIRLFVDGAMVLEELNGPSQNIDYVADAYEHNLYYIGRSFPNGLSSSTEFSMDGKVSNVGIWNRGLSTSEIQSLSQHAFDSTIPNLIGYWPLDDGAGTVAIDLSSTGNIGTLEGDTFFGGNCPTEDLDGDGVVAFEDCDDTDSGVSTGTLSSTISGPSLSNTISGWNNSGMQFTALTSTTLTSFTFNNQGLTDTVTLFDMTTNTLVQSLYVSPNSSSHTISPNWSLVAGHTYSLKNASGSNGRWVDYTTYPTQNSVVSIEGMIDSGNHLNTQYWFTFTNFTFGGCQ